MTQGKSQVKVTYKYTNQAAHKNSKLLTIHEFAKLTNITPRALRLWHKLGVLEPIYQDPKTKYRYYKIEQVFEVLNIKIKQDFGVPLKNIKKDSEISLSKLFKDRIKETQGQLRTLQYKLKFLKSFYKFSTKPETSIKHIEKPSQYLLVYNAIQNASYSKITDYIKFLWQCIKNPTEFCPRETVIYFDNYYKPINSNIVVGLILKKPNKKLNHNKLLKNTCKLKDFSLYKLENLMGLRAYFNGPYKYLPLAYRIITTYTIKHQINLYSPTFETYYRGPLNTKHEFLYKTEIFIPTQKPKMHEIQIIKQTV